MKLDPGTMLTEWLESKFLRGHTDETLEKDTRMLSRFFEFLKRQNVTDLAEVTPEVLANYSMELKHATSKVTGVALTVQTITGRLVALRMFFRFLTKRGFLSRDIGHSIVLPQQTRCLPRSPFSESEIERMLALPDTDTSRGIRDRAMLEVLYSTGIRRSELANLTLADIQDETLFIREGKGKKDRVVPCGARAMDWVQKYLVDARPELASACCVNLFVNLNGVKLHPEKVSEVVRAYKKLAGIEKVGASHLIRHTSATLMLENGADLRHIQEFLGHESVETTQIYTHLTTLRLREEHSTFHPGEKLSVTLKSPRRNRKQMLRHTPPRARKEPRAFPELFREIGEAYVAAMALRGYAHATLIQRRWYLTPFFEWLLSHGITDVLCITTDVLAEYGKHVRAHRQKNGAPYSARSIFRHMGIVFLFSRWLFESGRLMYNPALALDLPACPRSLPRSVLSAREAALIISRPDTDTIYGIRDRAILEVLFAAGLRRSELAGLKLSSFDSENETLRIYSPKTRSERLIPSGKNAALWIGRYLESAREKLDTGRSDLLFLADHGGGLHPQWVSGIVQKYMKMAGIQKSDPGHIFRRTCATLLLENGASIRTVQEILGHLALRTTQVYTRVTIRKLKEVHKRTHPAERSPLERSGLKPQASPVQRPAGPSVAPVIRQSYTRRTGL